MSQIYESLIQKNYSSEIQNEASIVSEQIVSRLSGAFKESLAMTNKLGGQCIGLADLNTSMADGVLMWVAKSDESEKGYGTIPQKAISVGAVWLIKTKVAIHLYRQPQT